MKNGMENQAVYNRSGDLPKNIVNKGLFAEAGSPCVLKILAIGNSFSQDGLEYLCEIADRLGDIKIVTGHLMIGGWSLSGHWRNATNDNPQYDYWKNFKGAWVCRPGRSIMYGLKDEDWDIISLQQVSTDSGVPGTYNEDLDNLIEYVMSNKTNPAAKLAWHMTWAYPQKGMLNNSPQYSCDQMTMYRAIVSAVKEKIVPRGDFDFIIPTGTAVQNIRASFVGDSPLTRDGRHLSLNLGRYLAGLTWYKALTGKPVDKINWVPDETEITRDILEVVKQSVNGAVSSPFEVIPPAGRGV